MTYYQSKIVQAEDIMSVRSNVEAALKTEGFGILTEIDIQATMKEKLDRDYKPYLILGACNPVFADKVLQVEPHIGTLLPCNVTIREVQEGNFEVAIMDPAVAMSLVENPMIEDLAGEVREKLERMLSNV